MNDERIEKPGLARSDDRRLQADLDRALTDKLLARSDSAEAFVREFEANTSLQLPTLADIDRTMARVESPTSESNPSLESLLSLDSVGDVAVEGIKLNELLNQGDITLQQRAAVKRGLLFLRRRLYAEAAEWFLINRPDDAASDPSFYCVATLLLAFTYRLSGQTSQAQDALQEAVRVRKFISFGNREQ